MLKGQKLIEEHVLKPMPLPAMNKWTKVAPTVARISLLGLFHNGFLARMFKEEFGELQDEASDLSNNEDDKLAVPINEARKWRILARRRNMRATHFLSDPQSLWINLLWCQLAHGAMKLHGRLFKNATWFSDRPERERHRPIHLLGTFCCFDENPAWANLKDLLGVLAEPEHKLSLLVWWFGPLAEWPQARRRIVRKAIMVMAGQLVRKLILPWQQYPWRLWPLALPDAGQEVRRECARSLLHSRPCCLDSGFSQRLRSLHMSEQELTSPEICHFLKAIFVRVVPTSTFIERRFAHFTHWSSSQPKFSTLAAKHITNFCRGAAQAWRDTCPNYVKERHNTRPEWVKQKSHRTTGFNLFQSDFRKTLAAQDVVGHGKKNFVQGASEAWQQLPAGEKAAYSVRAQGVNRLRSRSNRMLDAEGQQANEYGGLWGMSCLQDKWPLATGVLQESLGEGNLVLNRAGLQWEKARSSIITC